MSDKLHQPPIPTDVRMRGFARRATVEAALAWIKKQTHPLPAETVALSDACGRVLVGDVQSQVDVPGFERSMMDGFALHASDTSGATPYNRLQIIVIGQSLPGQPFEHEVRKGEAVRIMTGAPMPTAVDAVLPAEQVEIDGDTILAQGEVSPGKHVGRQGEDISSGTNVLSAGRHLRPQDIGVLSSIGVASVEVVRRPKVRIVVTGNELLPPGSAPEGYKIVDANSPMLASLIQRDGGIPINPGIIADEPNAILAAIRDDADVVLVSGGSSVGQEDHAPSLLAKHGSLEIHGIAMRPSSPAGMGRLDQRIVFLLPGNPVSCLCAYDFFAGRAIRALGGLSKDWPYGKTNLHLRRKLVSQVGRVDYARVKIVANQIEPLAISGASVLSSTTRADGFVIVPADSEGYPERSEVEVFLYG